MELEFEIVSWTTFRYLLISFGVLGIVIEMGIGIGVGIGVGVGIGAGLHSPFTRTLHGQLRGAYWCTFHSRRRNTTVVVLLL